MMKTQNNLMTPALRDLFNALNGQVYFVGGAVRDLLSKRPINDIDLTTPLTPAQVEQALSGTNIHIHPTGIKHGTLTLVLDDKTVVEITSFRADKKTDGRHAVVQFGQDIVQDAQRRDFTINAIYMDGDGNVLDFVGGLKDLHKKRLRFIGNPILRIEEDALRILRYFRFFAQTNQKYPDKATLKACRAKRHLIDNLSKQRIQNEILKLLDVLEPQRALHFMMRSGVLKKAIGIYDMQALRFLLRQEKRTGFKTVALFRLWVLCGGQLPDLAWSRAQMKLAASWQKALNMPFKTHQDIYEVLYRLGRDTLLNMLLIKRKDIYFPSFQFYAAFKTPVLPFTPTDVTDFFHIEGDKLGQKIRLCEDIWLKMGCPAKKEVVFERSFD